MTKGVWVSFLEASPSICINRQSRNMWGMKRSHGHLGFSKVAAVQFSLTHTTLIMLTFHLFSFLLNCREKAISNMTSLSMKQMFPSRLTHPEVIYVSLPTFYASKTQVSRSLLWCLLRIKVTLPKVEQSYYQHCVTSHYCWWFSLWSHQLQLIL